MTRVTWAGDNDLKLLKVIAHLIPASQVDYEQISLLFPGATAKAVLERMSKLKRAGKDVLDEAGISLSSATAAATPAATTAPKTSKKGVSKKRTAADLDDGDEEESPLNGKGNSFKKVKTSAIKVEEDEELLEKADYTEDGEAFANAKTEA